MKKFLVVLTFLLLTGALLFAGSQSEGTAQQDKTLNRYVVAKLQPFDPADMTDLYTHMVYGEIGEALFAYEYLNDNYVLRPVIAKAMPKVSSDGLVYTIELVQDAHFYDPLMEVFSDGKDTIPHFIDFYQCFSPMRSS